MSNYAPTGNPVQITRATSTLIRNEFAAIASSIATKGDISGQSWNGTHDFSGGVLRAALPVSGSDVATKAYTDNLVYTTVLPGQSLGFFRSTGSIASFGQTHTGYAQKEVRGTDIVCAATIDLSVATGNLVHITGSTGPVTAITIASGAEYTVVWDGTPTVTHNSTSLIIPGGLSATVSAGDVWKIRGDGSGNARVVSIQRSTGAPASDFPYMYVRDEVSSGNTGGNSVAADITQTRRLQTVVNNTISGASLASNTVTLPAGTYRFSGRAPAVQVSQSKCLLYNATDSTYVGIGSSAFAASLATSCTFDSFVRGVFTITASKNFTLRHWTNQATAGGLGTPASIASISEVYAELEFWKVA